MIDQFAYVGESMHMGLLLLICRRATHQDYMLTQSSGNIEEDIIQSETCLPCSIGKWALLHTRQSRTSSRQYTHHLIHCLVSQLVEIGSKPFSTSVQYLAFFVYFKGCQLFYLACSTVKLQNFSIKSYSPLIIRRLHVVFTLRTLHVNKMQRVMLKLWWVRYS